MTDEEWIAADRAPDGQTGMVPVRLPPDEPDPEPDEPVFDDPDDEYPEDDGDD